MGEVLSLVWYKTARKTELQRTNFPHLRSGGQHRRDKLIRSHWCGNEKSFWESKWLFCHLKKNDNLIRWKLDLLTLAHNLHYIAACWCEIHSGTGWATKDLWLPSIHKFWEMRAVFLGHIWSSFQNGTALVAPLCVGCHRPIDRDIDLATATVYFKACAFEY